MVRVFSRFIIGLNYDDFALAIKEARKFRQYFSNRRDYGIQAIQEAINDGQENAMNLTEELGLLLEMA